MILEMAAFICNLGKNNKLIGKDFYECKEKHEIIEKNYLNENEEFFENYFGEEEESFNHEDFKRETKKLVNQAIIEYIEGKIASKVHNAIRNAAALNLNDPKNTQDNKDEY
uniref:Uncharacterized protein n=1 Tax=Meloidogyne enterolobii TaxID=390850 RepID=A0A6V7TNI0_MELEN|nr:unnamed protein product [Meloidogyne enterolobii]